MLWEPETKPGNGDYSGEKDETHTRPRNEKGDASLLSRSLTLMLQSRVAVKKKVGSHQILYVMHAAYSLHGPSLDGLTYQRIKWNSGWRIGETVHRFSS